MDVSWIENLRDPAMPSCVWQALLMGPVVDLLHTWQRHEDAQTSLWRRIATPRPIIKYEYILQLSSSSCTQNWMRFTPDHMHGAKMRGKGGKLRNHHKYHNHHPQNPLRLSSASLHLQSGTNTSQGLGASSSWIQTLRFYLPHRHHHDPQKLKQGTWSRSLAGAPKTAKMASPMYSMTTPSKLSILRFGQGLAGRGFKVLNGINFNP